MADTFPALPDRPIKIKRSGIWPGIWSYLGGLLLLAIAAFIGIWQAPGIVRDIQIAQDPVVVYDADIANGECTVRRAIFVDCSADVSYEVKSKPFQHDIELMFVDIGSGDYEVEVVRSGAHPQLATLSLGLDMLWNRIIVAALFVIFLAIGGLALIGNGRDADRQRRVARRGASLTPTAVRITNVQKVLGGKAVQFQYGTDRKNKPLLTVSRFGRKEDPLWLGGDDGMALAVLPQGGKKPILVDSELSRLDLSPQERATLLTPAI